MQPAAVVLLVVHAQVLAAVRERLLQVGVDCDDGVWHGVVFREPVRGDDEAGVILARTRRLVQPHPAIFLEALGLRAHGAHR